MTDFKANRNIRTCPQQLDTYRNYDDAFGSSVNPLGSYDDATAQDLVPNGAWADLVFLFPPGTTAGGAAGAPIPLGTTGQSQTANGITVKYNAQGMPIVTSGVNSQPIAIQFKSQEPLFLSPFCFAAEHEWETGLFGCQNITITFNQQAPDVAHLLRFNTQNQSSPANPITNVTNIAQFSANGVSPFSNVSLSTQFLTPPLSLPLPPKSVVQYLEQPRQTQGVAVGTSGATGLTSQVISSPFVPDMMAIWVQKSSQGPFEADSFYPITNVSIQFANAAALCSTFTQQQLYNISKHNGLGEMSWNEWQGSAQSSKTPQGIVPLVGGPLLIKPSVDLPLPTGVAPGLPGQWTIQVQVGVSNPGGVADPNAVFYVVLFNSGFLESLRGSSRVIKGPITEQQILSAPLAPMATHGRLARLVGAGFFDKLSNVLGKAREVQGAVAPIVSAAKPAIAAMGPTGRTIAQGLSAVGLGRRSSIAQRLM